MQNMLNADLQERAIMHGGSLPWIPSPAPGVERRLLFRVGAEQARATSLVRYAPGSRFSAHSHPGGEEFLVLAGVFEDENGSYPSGTYVRNPPGSSHSPASAQGCIIFVRLRQFHSQDNDRVVVQLPESGDKQLCCNEHESVWLKALSPGQSLSVGNERGLELFVVDGDIRGEGFELGPWGWMRLPPSAQLHAVAGEAGARIWIKDASLELGF
ncbi:cupin domain-containing protein [Pseudomonas sp. BJa5]|uniref:cupin domain-containing protein n=1 Tax=Pseudomonas sp. BJa5 TaxID=2936270 RepID=UPI0025596C77|nr:cupin domain-containing protein [Pseudomonas sp. BGr12]MDL2420971.1 cupin domain-containing protein [Pseudomonas sp. BGr12]